jgi:FKBP-type peptidyl-prolyl cis-trans isomerase
MKKILYILIVVVFASCTKGYNEDYAVGKNDKENQEKEQQAKIDTSLMKVNEVMMQKEINRINAYISRRGWKMQNYSGVFVQITKRGQGQMINDKNIVTIEYECGLLNGDNVYSSKDNGKKVFRVGGDTQVEKGLMIAMKLLNKSSQANIIIPSNLAYGMNGDGEKIPASNPIVYKVKVIEVK